MNNEYGKEAMNEAEGELMSHLREHFSDELTPDIKRRLQQARHAALDSLDKDQSLFKQTWFAPAMGTAAAVAVGLTLMLQSQQPSLDPLLVADLDLTDAIYLAEISEQETELLNASLEADLDLGFYAWLEQQPEFME